jgi:DMSO/TMAO reductase YedYZ heme-binding membrane subunit
VTDPRADKLILFVNGLVPLGILGWDVYHQQAGADPTLLAIHTTGNIALIFILLTLAVTPIQQLSGWNYLFYFRRMLGLFAFFYGCIHLGIYFVVQRQMNIISLFSEATRHWFIFLGMAALLLMAPLAATSTNGIIKAMGAKKWKRLHKLIYPSAVLAGLHFYAGPKKADESWPIAYFVTLCVLLGLRPLIRAFPELKRKRAPKQRVA